MDRPTLWGSRGTVVGASMWRTDCQLPSGDTCTAFTICEL